MTRITHINYQKLSEISFASQSQGFDDSQDHDLICFIIKTKCKNIRKKGGTSSLLYEIFLIDETYSFGKKNKEIVYQAWGDEASMLQHQGIVQGTFIFIHNYENKKCTESYNDINKKVITLTNGKLYIFHDKDNNLLIPTDFHDECLPILRSKLKSLHDWINASPYATIKSINNKFDCIESKYVENFQSLYTSPAPKFDMMLTINKENLLRVLSNEKYIDKIEEMIDVKDCDGQTVKLCNVYKNQIEDLKLDILNNTNLDEIVIYSSRLTVSYIYYSKIRKINAESDSSFVISNSLHYSSVSDSYSKLDFIDLIQMNNNPDKLLQYKDKVVLVNCSLRYILWNVIENNSTIFLENLIKIRHDCAPKTVSFSNTESGKKRKQKSAIVYDSRIKTAYENAYFFIGGPKGTDCEDNDSILKVKVTDTGLTKIFANIPSSLVSIAITKENFLDTTNLTREQQILLESLPKYNYADAVRSIINSLNECAKRRDNFLFEIQIQPLMDENEMVIVSNCHFVLKNVRFV